MPHSADPGWTVHCHDAAGDPATIRTVAADGRVDLDPVGGC